MKMKRHRIIIGLLVLLLTTLAGCSGGSSKSIKDDPISNSGSTGSSNWGEMNWNDGSWG